MKFWQNTPKVLLIIDSHRFPQSQMNAIAVGPNFPSSITDLNLTEDKSENSALSQYFL